MDDLAAPLPSQRSVLPEQAAPLPKPSRSIITTPRAFVVGLAVFALTLAVYIPSLSAPFVWDDHYLILKAPRVTEPQPLRDYFASGFWVKGDVDPVGRNYYRPLTILSLALDYRVHGINPGGYHLTNIVLHALNGVLLFALLARRKLNPWLAGLLALGWAWFPRLTEAAAWISGRTDVLAAFFVLLALWLTPARNPAFRWLAALSLLLGALAKEVAMAGLVAVACMEWLSALDKPRRQRLLRLLPLLCVAIAYCGLRMGAIGAGLKSSGMPLGMRLACALDALGRYVVMVLDGWHPTVQIGYLGEVALVYVVVGVLTLLVAGYGLARNFRRFDHHTWGAIALCAVSLGLVLHVVPITVNIASADRFMYLPLAGLVLAVAPLFRGPWLKRPVVLALALLVLSYGPTTFARTKDWCDEVDFWLSAFRVKRTHNTTSRLELGNVFNRAGLHSHARAIYLDAQPERGMNYTILMNNLGIRLVADGESARAIEVLKLALTLAPDVPRFHYSLAVALLSAGRLDEAEKAVEAGRKLNPESSSPAELKAGIEKVRTQLRLPAADLTTTLGKVQQATILASQFRSREALDLLVEASKAPDMPMNEIIPGLLYAFDAGSPRQVNALYEAYRAQGGRAPEVLENYQIRMERVARLRAVWPTLAEHRTDPAQHRNSPFVRVPGFGAPAGTPSAE